MDAIAAEVKCLLDRESIRDCVSRLARGEDRRDTTLINACYWPDATCDFGIFSGTLAEYLAWVVPGSPAIRLTQHVLGQSVIDLAGDTALVETHVTSYHRVNTGEDDRDLVICGRYLDRTERRGGEWRIAQRTMLYDWAQSFGLSIDWSQGLMGTPFSADHYTGKAVGDFSETFFRKKSSDQ